MELRDSAISLQQSVESWETSTARKTRILANNRIRNPVQKWVTADKLFYSRKAFNGQEQAFRF
jgi:hypothetical protein